MQACPFPVRTDAITFLIFIPFYLVFLLISLSFFDAHTPFDARILSPVFVCGLIVVLHLLYRLLRSAEGTRCAQTAILAGCVLFAVSYLGSGAAWTMRSHNEGRGYASKSWQQSALIAGIRSQPEGTLIYSNGPDAVHMLTGRFARAIPAKLNAGNRALYESYPSGLNSMREELESQGGILAYFNTITWRDYFPSENELKEALPLTLLAREDDGSIYEITKNGE